tara:strand:- start:751 stop:1101 length:351 start_codon:yes stop_codon:yes gene_type:complete
MATKILNGIEYPVPGIDTAIKILRPKARWEILDKKFTIYECDEGTEPPSWDEITAELKREVEVYNQYLYAREREKSYPDIKSQLDMLYHDIKNSQLENGTWIKTIDDIKSKYPKPS